MFGLVRVRFRLAGIARPTDKEIWLCKGVWIHPPFPEWNPRPVVTFGSPHLGQARRGKEESWLEGQGGLGLAL